MSGSLLLTLLPALLVDVGGLLLALARWGRHPTASLLAALGLALRLPAALAPAWYLQGLGAGDGVTRSLVVGATSLASTVGLALVVAAVFAGRGEAAR